jgi:hypothetical protein
MSESSSENSDDSPGLISDEQLPEDLRPSENPLAADAEDDPDGEGPKGAAGPTGGDDDGDQAAGMPDMGGAGAPG